MSNLFVRKPRTEYVRLLGLSLWIPTDEQQAKAARTLAEKGRNPRNPTISLRVECEPLSYQFVDENGVVSPDQRTFKYFELTYGLEPADIAAARQYGLTGVPENRIITATLKGGPDEQRNPFPRWYKYLEAAGFSMDVDGTGQPTSDAIGKVFKTIEGEDTFPSSRFDQRTKKWVNTDLQGKPLTYTQSNLQYLVEAAPTYVQDPETVRRITVRKRDEDGDAAAVSAMGASSIGATLREAVKAAELVGRNTIEFSSPRAQVTFCEASIGVAPVFISDEVHSQAVAGNLLSFLVEQEAIVVTADGTILGVD